MSWFGQNSIAHSVHNAVAARNAQAAGGQPGTGAGLMSMGKNLLGLATGSAGTSLLGDVVGGLGTVLGNQLMKGVFGGGASQSNSATNAAVNAADAMTQHTAQNKSSLLQNTNAMGQQGNAAALEAKRRINSQMVSGAVADKNRMLAQGDNALSGASTQANAGMRQNQMSQQGLASMIKNMASGGPTAKLGNLGALSQQSAQNNLAAMNAGAQIMGQANNTALNAQSMASDVFNKDLASNFERNVKPALNNWENFQGMAASLGGPAAGNAMSIANGADNASYNLAGGTAQMLGTRAGIQNANEQYMNWANPLQSQANTATGVDPRDWV